MRELSEFQYYMMHLSIVEIFMPDKLTPKEKEFLAHFMCVESRLDVMFITQNRRKVINLMGGFTSANLSNYLKKLVKKRYLQQDAAGNYKLLPALIPNLEGNQLYQLKLSVKKYG